VFNAAAMNCVPVHSTAPATLNAPAGRFNETELQLVPSVDLIAALFAPVATKHPAPYTTEPTTAPDSVPVLEVQFTPSVDDATLPEVLIATHTPFPYAKLETVLKLEAKSGITPSVHVSPLSLDNETTPFAPPTNIVSPFLATDDNEEPYEGGVVGATQPLDTSFVLFNNIIPLVPTKTPCTIGSGGAGGIVFLIVSITVSNRVSVSTVVTKAVPLFIVVSVEAFVWNAVA
jgi:hypothetical protein